MELKQGKLLKIKKQNLFFKTSDKYFLINIYAVNLYEFDKNRCIIAIFQHTNQAIEICKEDLDRFYSWLDSWGIDAVRKTKKKGKLCKKSER